MAAGPPMRPTGVWASTSAIGVPVQPALVSWPFQVGLSGIQISGSWASGSLSCATTSFTVPAVTWMSMHGSSAATVLTASFTSDSITGAVVSVISSLTQSGPSASASSLAAQREEAGDAEHQREREAGEQHGLARTATGGGSGFGRGRVVLTHEVLPQERQSGVWARLISSSTARGRTRK